MAVLSARVDDGLAARLAAAAEQASTNVSELIRSRLDVDPAGVWVAYYSDFGSMAVYPSEIEALRAAVAGGQDVTFLPYGVNLVEHVHAEFEARRSAPL